jgi:hypothetical protein
LGFGRKGKHRQRPSSPATGPSRPRRFRPQVEALESRYAPAVTFDGVSAVNHIAGTGNDCVELRLTGATTNVYDHGTYLGSTGAINLSANLDPTSGAQNCLFVNDSAYGGGDNYFITDTDVRISPFTYADWVARYTNVQCLKLATGAGNDTITITNNFHTLDYLPKICVDGGGGTNVLNVDDSGYPFGDTYVITGTQVCLPYTLGLIVTYRNISQTNLTTGAGNDTIILENCYGALDGIHDVTVDAGGGFNTLDVVDQGYPWGDSYQIDSFAPGKGDVLVGGLGLVVSFQHIQLVNLWTSTGLSSVYVHMSNPNDFGWQLPNEPPPPPCCYDDCCCDCGGGQDGQDGGGAAALANDFGPGHDRGDSGAATDVAFADFHQELLRTDLALAGHGLPRLAMDPAFASVVGGPAL